MKLALAIGLLLGITVAYADQAPPAFRLDPSKPVALEQINPAEPNDKPVSPGTNQAWKNYDSPLRECTKGDSVFPSNGQDMFSGLFHNPARVDVTMSIKGWQEKPKKVCVVNFTEATNVMYCHFNNSELQDLMKAILNSDQYNPTSPFAQTLATNCSPTPPEKSLA